MTGTNGQNPTSQGPSTTIKLEILLDTRTGQVGVNIPNELLGNMLACYGLLEVARQSIQTFVATKAASNRIVPANVLPMLRQ